MRDSALWRHRSDGVKSTWRHALAGATHYRDSARGEGADGVLQRCTTPSPEGVYDALRAFPVLRTLCHGRGLHTSMSTQTCATVDRLQAYPTTPVRPLLAAPRARLRPTAVLVLQQRQRLLGGGQHPGTGPAGLHKGEGVGCRAVRGQTPTPSPWRKMQHGPNQGKRWSEGAAVLGRGPCLRATPRASVSWGSWRPHYGNID